MKSKNKVVLIVACLVLSVIGIAAQSTNPSSPTQLSGEYTSKGPNKETDFYFSFTGGPGNVSIGLDITPKDYSTFARIEIGNNPSNLIAMHNMNASTTTGPANVVKTFKLAQKQAVRIKLTLDGNLAEYKLSISGGGVGGEDAGSSPGPTGKVGTTGKAGKLTTGSGTKLGSLGKAGGQPKTGTQGSTASEKKDLQFFCPAKIEYMLVAPAGWNGGLYGKQVYMFSEADSNAAARQMTCTYRPPGGGGHDVTIYREVPAGYSCKLINTGKSSKEFVCTIGITASILYREIPASTLTPFSQASFR